MICEMRTRHGCRNKEIAVLQCVINKEMNFNISEFKQDNNVNVRANTPGGAYPI